MNDTFIRIYRCRTRARHTMDNAVYSYSNSPRTVIPSTDRIRSKNVHAYFVLNRLWNVTREISKSIHDINPSCPFTKSITVVLKKKKQKKSVCNHYIFNNMSSNKRESVCILVVGTVDYFAWNAMFRNSNKTAMLSGEKIIYFLNKNYWCFRDIQ